MRVYRQVLDRRRRVPAAAFAALAGVVAVGSVGIGVPDAGAVPVLAVAPASVNFTTQLTGTTSLAQNVLVSNPGNTVLTIAAVTVAGPNAAEFAVTNGCTAPVAAGGACIVSLTYSPVAAGSSAATLTVGSDGGIGTVALSGTALAAGPVLAVQPGVLTFTGITVGTTSAAATETVSNTGSAPLVLGALTLGGANAAEFSVTNGCPASIAPNASCPIAVQFTPAAAGNRAGTLTIASNGGTVGISLSGGAVPAAAPVLSTPAAATFAAQTMGFTSAIQNVSVTNSGNAPMTVSGATLSGGNAADFALTNNCAASVAPGGSCTIAVRHTPQAVGARASTLTVSSNGGTKSVALSGTGTIAGGCPAPGTGWYGQYWGNSSVTGAPSTCRIDAAVRFNWLPLLFPPAGGLLSFGNFSARWTKTETFAAGTYTFTATATDGVRLYVDGSLRIDSWVQTVFSTSRVASVPLSAGTHTVVLEYFNRHLLGADVALSWR